MSGDVWLGLAKSGCVVLGLVLACRTSRSTEVRAPIQLVACKYPHAIGAAGADVLVTVLPGPGQVRDLMLGSGAVATALRGGTTWIDVTSNSSAVMTEVRNAVLGRGMQILDAPLGARRCRLAGACPAWRTQGAYGS